MLQRLSSSNSMNMGIRLTLTTCVRDGRLPHKISFIRPCLMVAMLVM